MQPRFTAQTIDLINTTRSPVEREPEVHPGLLDLDNVVLVPHLGSATVETRTAMAELAARNVAAVLAGEAPPTPVA